MKNYRRLRSPTLAMAAAAAYLRRRLKRRSIRRKTTTTNSILNRRHKKRYQRRYRRKYHKETNVPAAEYTRENATLGKKYRLSPYKVIKQNMGQTTYALRNYTQFAGASGALTLVNTSPTTTTGPFNVPMHLYELTSAVNIFNGAVTAPAIRWVPVFSDPTAASTLSWTNDQAISVENSDSASAITTQYPTGSDTLSWAQIKLMFYCPTTLPARIQVDIVQIKDTRLVPDSVTGVSQFANAFYQAMIKRFAYSPLETGDQKYQKYLKVLYSNTFIMNPKESTEAVNTIYRELNIFQRINRRCTYDWADQDQMAMLSQDGQINTDTNVRTQVHPRARIFLIIRGQSRNGTAFSSATMPSYDILLRMKHQFLSN